ncbi:AMP-forming long-chain acyl-CoA synthetase [Nitzschia inconspicua]|uniref:AMP-forming long-chain acyl-CoA synthetase n=1 Tax=Nitzschia inconspicua TaxID=303405 RepID=A0A9K3L9I1_9STRA|nr:AMP-forming long-chain acyl-CoA synthetase [Nitzschia inconspicua]
MSKLAFLPLQILLIAIDLLISFLTFGWIKVLKKLSAPVPVRSVPVADDPSHRVREEFKGKLAMKPSNGASTLHEMAANSFKAHANEVCMRKRVFLGWKDDKKKVKKFAPDLIEMTYAQVGEKAYKFGAALRGIGGCVPSDANTTLDKVTKPCRIAIFENTCPEWMISALGAFSQSIGVATVYATLGIDAVTEAVVDNSISVIVCNKTNVKYLTEKCKDMPCLKVIVYTNDLISPDDTVDLPSSPPKGIQIYSFDEFVELGDTTKFPLTAPTPETTAVIMYTSGSTGKPKGVVITHQSTLAGCSAAEYVLALKSSDEYLAYLPLAHIMELMVEFVVLANGCSLNYADPKSLTATGAYPTGALEAFGPTHMVAVPKIWDTIKKGLLAKVSLSSPVAQVLVHTALQWRTFAVKYGLDTPLFNALVFKKFKKAVGGNLKWALSGGGPLNGEVQEFIRVAFALPLIQGYGLTETCAGLTIQAEDDDRPGVAGQPIPSCEVKLVSTPDVCDRGGLPYLSTDRKDVDGNPVWGRGEVMVKGGNVTSGYYMMPDKTKEVFLEDGWFATGDIGQFLEDGSIRIVDRKKNLVKLKSGEYVALEKMEMVYGNSDFVDAISGGICCYADGDMDRPVALFQLNEVVAMKWAKANGVSGDFEAVQKSKQLYDAVMQSFNEEHAKSDLSHIEKINGVVMLTSPWTPENGCLTAANKLQRRAVIEQFSVEFEGVKQKGIF